MIGFIKRHRLRKKNMKLRRIRFYESYKDTCHTCKYYEIVYDSYGDSCRVKHPDFDDSSDCSTKCECYQLQFKYKNISKEFGRNEYARKRTTISGK